MNKTHFILILFLIPFLRVYSQSDSARKDKFPEVGAYWLSVRAAYLHQANGYAEAGLYFGIATDRNPINGGAFYGPSISTEFLLKSQSDNHNIIGPKIGFDCSNAALIPWATIPWGGRIDIIDYTDGKQTSIKILPQVGLSLLSIINIYYGYNIPLTNRSLVNNNGSVFTLMLSIPLRSACYNKPLL